MVEVINGSEPKLNVQTIFQFLSKKTTKENKLTLFFCYIHHLKCLKNILAYKLKLKINGLQVEMCYVQKK